MSGNGDFLQRLEQVCRTFRVKGDVGSGFYGVSEVEGQRICSCRIPDVEQLGLEDREQVADVLGELLSNVVLEAIRAPVVCE